LTTSFEALIGASSSSFAFRACTTASLELRLTTSTSLIGVAYAPPTSPFAFRAALLQSEFESTSKEYEERCRRENLRVLVKSTKKGVNQI
jgi:hypothetical protein